MAEPYTKCGKHGNTVYQRNRYGQISYPYRGAPKNPRSESQQFVRGSFGSVSARWRLLTELQRLHWRETAKSKKTRSRLGQRFRMNGFNYFVQVNVARVNRGLAELDLPPAEGYDLKPALPLISELLFLKVRGLLDEPSPVLPQFLKPAPPPGS